MAPPIATRPTPIAARRAVKGAGGRSTDDVAAARSCWGELVGSPTLLLQRELGGRAQPLALVDERGQRAVEGVGNRPVVSGVEPPRELGEGIGNDGGVRLAGEPLGLEVRRRVAVLLRAVEMIAHRARDHPLELRLLRQVV